MSAGGWIGVDLDGTLARYESKQGIATIGEPIPAMVARVKQWLDEGREVRIVTARVSGTYDDVESGEQTEMIAAWCVEHIGCALEVTCTKDFAMIELWDDRAVTVEKNTGRCMTGGR